MGGMLFSLENQGARRALAVLGCASTLFWASACGEGEGDRDSWEKVPTVEVMTVEPELLRDTVKFGGQLSSEKSVLLKSELEGVVASIEFEEGQRVKKGQTLIRLRSDEMRARLQVAEANLALAAAESDRTHKLLDRKAAAQSQRDRRTAELAVAEARVELARVDLARTRITAPFDGVVGMRLVQPGAFVTDKDALVQIDAVDRLQAVFAMSEVLLPFASVGYPIEVLVAPYPGEKFPGKVFFVSPTLDTAARRILTKAWVPNEHGKLAAGLYANIEVEIARREGAIILPESAVVSDRVGTFVWRIGEEEIAERIPVEIGLRKHGRVEVTLGLRAGDRVVTAGTHKVNAGKKVAAAMELPAGQASVPPEGEPVGEGT
jgi:membrane fusion protein (multidrug efflux system)